MILRYKGRTIKLTKLKKFLLLNVSVILTVVLYVFVLSFLHIGCPIKALIRVDCPTCGVTRALFSLLKGDFCASIRWHPMAVPLLSVFILQINRTFFCKKALLAVDIATVTVALANFTIYLLRF